MRSLADAGCCSASSSGGCAAASSACSSRAPRALARERTAARAAAHVAARTRARRRWPRWTRACDRRAAAARRSSPSRRPRASSASDCVELGAEQLDELRVEVGVLAGAAQLPQRRHRARIDAASSAIRGSRRPQSVRRGAQRQRRRARASGAASARNPRACTACSGCRPCRRPGTSRGSCAASCAVSATIGHAARRRALAAGESAPWSRSRPCPACSGP